LLTKSSIENNKVTKTFKNLYKCDLYESIQNLDIYHLVYY